MGGTYRAGLLHYSVHNNVMARPKEHNEEDVRMAALQAFWRDGYADTSLADLEEATGLGRRSLYNSFGDKKTIFLRALEDFRAMAAAQNLSPLDAPGAGTDAVAATLNGLVAAAGTPQGANGCLICNTAREAVGRDPDVAEQVNLYFTRIERSFAKALHTEKARGGLPENEHVKDLSRFYLGVLVSLCVLARAGAPSKTLEAIVREALKRIR